MVRHHGAERYPNPEIPWRDILVLLPNPNLDDPPAPDEGEIRTVDFEYSNVLAKRLFKQACRTSIQWSAPHIRVSVFLYAPEERAIRGNFKGVHLSDRECWVAWAKNCE